MCQDVNIDQLKKQLQSFLNQLDKLEPSQASVEDVDRLIKLIEEMEQKLT
ncbi:SE1561 family protein [Amphibacillus cookii]|nr:SE1561 family protein [Amphibacillus cookii]MBM7542118.1 hypothetical protein [Amphibacillus cookii]